MRSMHSSEKIEELVTELEGYRWDAILLSETWRHEPAELWEIHHNHIFMGAGKYENKHGVGIMLNRRWRKRIIDTDYINERAIKTTILVNRRHIDLMSVYFPHQKYADHHIEKMYKTIEKHMTNNKKCIPIIGGDFNAELGPGKGTERKSVGMYTLNESNKRGDWFKSWLMLNDYSALNTMFKKTLQKQTSIVSPKGKEKQIDYILTKRRYLSNVKDAEANDMIHMGSDHRCIMATFLISTPEKNKRNRREDKKRRPTVNIEETKKDKNINIENPELEERYQDIIVTIKKAAAKKENEAHDTRNNAKDRMEMERKNAAAAAEAESTFVETVAQETEGRSKKRSSKDDNQRDTAAASEAESTLVDTVVHETEGRSKKRSSKDDNLRGGLAHLEHRRPDGWSSTPRGSDDEKKCSERDETSSHPLVRTGGEEDAHEIITNTGCSSSCDMRAGERLPKQRPLGDEHLERIPEEHPGAQMIHQVGEAGSIVLHNSPSSSVFKNDSNEIQETTSAAAKKKEECVDKDAEILRLIEERRSMPKEEKQRLKDLSKNIKNVSEKKE